MASDFENLIGKGLYTIPEASRLVSVPAQTIRRWLEGYSYKYQDETRFSDSFVRHELPRIGNQLAITFQELIEVRFVHLFRDFGVSWKTIRLAAERAKYIFGAEHPFTRLRFRTDGRAIFADIAEETGEARLLDLAKSQWAMEKVIRPSLYRQLDYSDVNDVIVRWWPMGKAKSVVVDPERSFGQPIVEKEGIPTRTLFNAYNATDSIEEVCHWFEVSRKSVRDSLAFERRV